jgi:hypothetical protein
MLLPPPPAEKLVSSLLAPAGAFIISARFSGQPNGFSKSCRRTRFLWPLIKKKFGSNDQGADGELPTGAPSQQKYGPPRRFSFAFESVCCSPMRNLVFSVHQNFCHEIVSANGVKEMANLFPLIVSVRTKIPLELILNPSSLFP